MADEFYDERKRFMEEMILRFEKAFQRVDRSMAANTRALNELRREWEAHSEDYLSENRAQRQALLHILDELKGHGGSAAA